MFAFHFFRNFVPSNHGVSACSLALAGCCHPYSVTPLTLQLRCGRYGNSSPWCRRAILCCSPCWVRKRTHD